MHIYPQIFLQDLIYNLTNMFYKLRRRRHDDWDYFYWLY
jgi:hypothetical protein